MKHFDYIISGGGCAGLSLVYHLLNSPLRNKKVLLIDRQPKDQNDRTWSYWESGKGPFEEIVFHKWSQLAFHAERCSRSFRIDPFYYKMIRGIDFYQFVEDKLQKAPQVTILRAKVEGLINRESHVEVIAGGRHYTADWCFNSILFQPIDRIRSNYLDQHFKGWFIETQQPVFDPGQAVLMDFRTAQMGETRFLYVLPFDEHHSLVEVAIFSNQRLSSDKYDQILAQYVREYITAQAYQVQEQEIGVIPMTDFPFTRSEGRTIHLGTAGGDTKASTGYTFRNIQLRCAGIVDELLRSGVPYVGEKIAKRRFSLYDAILLKILAEGRAAGDEIFTRLFRGNPPQRLLRFLNEDSGLLEEMALMRTLPAATFLKVFFEEIWKKKIGKVSNLPIMKQADLR